MISLFLFSSALQNNVTTTHLVQSLFPWHPSTNFYLKKDSKPKILKNPLKRSYSDKNTQQNSTTLPIYICHDRRSFDSSQQPSSVTGSSQQPSSVTGSSVISERTDVKSVAKRARNEPVAVLSGYVGQYIKNVSFRVNINERCLSCLQKRKKKKGFDSESFSLMEMGINTIERFFDSSVMNLDSLQKCIKNLNIVTTLNSSNSTDPSCRKTNSYLSSCANLYLSIIYKIVKNDKVSAWHLLQVFCDATFLARSHLLPELWDHLFLPHLLHLKIWYNKELDCVARLDEDERERGRSKA